MQVLPGKLDPAALDFGRDGGQCREGRRDHDLYGGDVPTGLDQLPRQLAARGPAAIHLPVPRDDLLSHGQTRRRASTPGSRLPSMNSSDAPPPVEMNPILDA